MAVEARLLEAMETTKHRVPEVIRALMAARHVTGPDLASAIGMSASSLYARLNGKSTISAQEVAALALYFRVPVGFLYEPPEGLVEATTRAIGGYLNPDIGLPAAAA